MIRRTTLVMALIFSIAILPIAAVSQPVITGNIAGVELCPQSICGVAAFAGNFIGQVNSKPTRGVFWAGITHDPLPEPGFSADITGGTWLIHTPKRVFFGTVEPGGTLYNNGNNTFMVTLTLVLTKGGNGTLTFTGILDHNPFPPTIVGAVTQ